MGEPFKVLLLSGSTRTLSTNTAALQTAGGVAPAGMVTVMYKGLSALPVFNPDDDAASHPAVADLREQLAAADAVLFCTPEYAGTLPGGLKNLLEWTIGGGDLYGKPVAWINVASPGRGEGAQVTLASVLGYMGAVVVESACARIPVGRDAVSMDGLVKDPAIRAGIENSCRDRAVSIHPAFGV